MAGARTKTTISSDSNVDGQGPLPCPECGKQFTRPASLGAHRRAAHGVQGSSGRARRSRAQSAPRPANAGSRRPASAGSQRMRTKGGLNRRSAVDHDALLQALFPDGIPARQHVIRELDRWLQEAERLARLS